MRLIMMKLLVVLMLMSPVFANSERAKIKVDEEAESEIVQGHVFAWPFIDALKMQPRGGMTRGSEVKLDLKPSQAWNAANAQGLTRRERDRQAILAMAGDFRVSFDFIETAGFTRNYQPPRPYFSWGTEHVAVIESRADFVSLQHTLVMYFEHPETNKTEVMTMKHWRQDWTYEDESLHVYLGKNTWEQRNAKRVEGRWSQAVYQVDDSPRYEVMGRWSHTGGVHTWKSDTASRPLPRREFSARDDYNILAGEHVITITPNGWIHTQQNRKENLPDFGKREVLALEYGVNRYERITEPSLAPASEEWVKVALYWAEVRKKWAEVYALNKRFKIHQKVDGKTLWEHHFSYAAEILKRGYQEDEGREHARATIEKFLASADAAKSVDY